MNYIARFNPYDMSEETVLAVATGRKKMLADVLEVLEDNLTSSGARQHLLIWGPRGMGKSFFLKYLKIEFERHASFVNSQFVLLPEEQSNINSVSDLIHMIFGYLENGSTESVFSSWTETEEDWLQAYKKLKTYCEQQKEIHQQFSLVVVVENLNEFLLKIKNDKFAQSRFRSLLERLENFTLIGASPHSKIDNNYNKRLFKAFKEFKLRPWEEEDYFRYFERRWEFHQIQNQLDRDEAQKQLQLNKLKAISKFTGGSPRMAVVLTDLLLEEDVFSTVNTLYGLVDDLTPYYQDLTKSIRPQSRKIFDTLIRAGENKSQSEIAEILKTSQNTISKPFKWLIENGYVEGKKRIKEKSFSYAARDRIYVLYYHRREIYHNKNYTPVWLLSDFLLTVFQGNELKARAIKSLRERHCQETVDLAKISLLAKGYSREDLPDYKKPEEWIQALEELDIVLPEHLNVILEEIKKLDKIEQKDELIELLQKVSDIFQNNLSHKEQELLIDQLLDITVEFSNKERALYELSIEIETVLLDIIPSDSFINLRSRCIEYLGIDSRGLKYYYKAINYHKQALELNKKVKNKDGEAWSLEHIGRNLKSLEQYEESISMHKQALEIYKEEEHINGQAIQIEQIGLNLNSLQRNEQAIEYHKQALELRIKEENRIGEAWNLDRIGHSLKNLERYEGAISMHKQALEICKEKEHINGQAIQLEQIASNLELLEKYGEAIEYYKQALELRIKEENRIEEAWNLDRIGHSLRGLEQYEEAINFRNQALIIFKEKEDIDGQAVQFGQIGINLYYLKKYEEAIKNHEYAFLLREKENNEKSKTWNLGHIGVNYFLLNDPDKAWKKLDDYEGTEEKIFKEFGDAVVHIEEHQGQAAGFKLAMQLLLGLKERKEQMNIPLSLSYFFADLLNMKISNTLLEDITEEALTIFTDANAQVVIKAALHTVQFLESEKDPAFLEQLSPDEAIAVRAIVEEGKL